MLRSIWRGPRRPTSFGRRTRRTRGTHRSVVPTRGAGLSTSTRFRIVIRQGRIDALHLASRPDAGMGRALRRSELPLAFTQGHHPHIKMSFGPPLPPGLSFPGRGLRPRALTAAGRRPPGEAQRRAAGGTRGAGLSSHPVQDSFADEPARGRFLPRALPARAHDRRRDRSRHPGSTTRPRDRGPHGPRSPAGAPARRRASREFDARPSIVALEPGSDAATPVLDCHLRFTPRASVRPEELLAELLPEADSRGADVERTALWAEPGAGGWIRSSCSW